MNTLELAKQLISFPSITPADAGCQALIEKELSQSEFSITHLPKNKAHNLWARYGESNPLLVFAGHTDVVDPGSLDAWSIHPFEPVVRDGMLIGRGAQDMKGPLAAMVVAAQQFVKKYPNFPGSIGFAITSAEEGDDYNDGTPVMVDYLKKTNQSVEWCVIGEPSCSKQFGDIIKNGRRGSLNAFLTIHGIQGHVAYPQLADNPVHKALPALEMLRTIEWCDGNNYFPPTSMQIVHVQAGNNRVGNVIPADLQVRINWRYSAELSADDIKKQVKHLLDEKGLQYSIRWELSGEPFLTPAGTLTDIVKNVVMEETGITPELSTSGGTSDGRFLAKLGGQTIEFGCRNNSIHQVNEQVSIAELEKLTTVYFKVLEKIFNP